MKIIKKLLIALVILFSLIIGILILIPVVFKDKIVERTKASISEQIDADVDFKDVSFSLIRSFPKASLSLEELTIDGRDQFEGFRMASIKELQLDFDILSLVQAGRPIELNRFDLVNPRIHLFTGIDSISNYDIFLPENEPSTKDTTQTSLDVDLQGYSIEKGYVLYEDLASDMRIEIPHLDHSGKLKYQDEIIELTTNSKYDSLLIGLGGISYLDRPSGEITLDMMVNLEESVYSISNNKLTVNELELTTSGELKQVDNGINLDMIFQAPGTDFRELLSLLPNAYTQDFQNVQADGSFELSGKINGTYNWMTGSLPAFNMKLNVMNGRFRYPELPYGIDDIRLNTVINQPGSSLNEMAIDLNPFRFSIDGQPFSAAAKIRQPISDPDADVRLNGTIDVEKFGKVLPTKNLDLRKGSIIADVQFKGRQSDISRKAYNQIQASGSLNINELSFSYDQYPAISIPESAIQFSPQAVEIEKTEILFGNSDATLDGRIENILALASGDQSIGGQLNIESRLIDINEWMPAAAATSDGTALPSNRGQPVFNRYGMEVNMLANEILYEDYLFRNTNAIVFLQGGDLSLENAKSELFGNKLELSGSLSGLVDYLLGQDILRGDLVFKSPRLDLNKLVPAEEGSNSDGNNDENLIVPVPSGMHLAVVADIGKCIYGSWELSQVKGNIDIADETLSMHKMNAKGLGGDLLFDGTYSTKDIENPTFDLKYDLQGLSFDQTFTEINTIRQLAPVGKYIKGKFNNSMILSGTLGKDLLPSWSTFNAAGMVETRNAVLEQITPFEKIGSLLKLDYFSQVPLQNSRNWFEVTNGVLEVKPFDIKHKDLFVTISGQHTIAQDINYKIRVKVPRDEIEKTGITREAGSFWNKLEQEAGQLGIDIQQGNYLVFDFNLSGAVADPKVTMKFAGTSTGPDDDNIDAPTSLPGEIKGQVKQRVEEEKEKAISEVKDTLTAISKKVQDSLRTLAEEKAKQTEKELKDKIAETGKELEGKLTDSLEKQLGDSGKEEIEDIKEKLGKWNPFKKDEEEKKN